MKIDRFFSRPPTPGARWLPLPLFPLAARIGIAIVAVLSLCAGYIVYALGPRDVNELDGQFFRIDPGEGFFEIAQRLQAEDIIRSSSAFSLLAILSGNAGDVKPGTYALSPAQGSEDILATLVRGIVDEVEVVIPEGATIYQIDDILSDAGIIAPRSLVLYALTLQEPVEGRLFPDRYRFYRGSSPGEIVRRMTARFTEQAEPVIGSDPENSQNLLILASMLEREVPDDADRRIVAGILEKRRRAGMPLQVDATICYAKQVAAGSAVPCYPLTGVDLKMDSPYNTYLHQGWPPGPIGNPGKAALEAARDPVASPYWFYLSDPATGKTIFSKTLDEHRENRVKYLR
jgi:UPF0755 protein